MEEDVTVKAYPKNFTTTSSFHGVERNEIGLKYLPKPDYLEFSLPNTHVALITNDGSELTQQVIQALEQKGNKVVVLNPNQFEVEPKQLLYLYLNNLKYQIL